jgi:mRNA-degrading endonuclease toxin of MazEF toxin-antitoxin module
VCLPEPVGRQPVLLVGRAASFSYLTRVLGVDVTTTVRWIPQQIPLGEREGLARPCVANLNTLRTVPRTCLVRRIGRLAANRHIEVSVRSAMCCMGRNSLGLQGDTGHIVGADQREFRCPRNGSRREWVRSASGSGSSDATSDNTNFTPAHAEGRSPEV